MNEYGFIKNKEEMLEVVARERAESGEMSRLEKTYIDMFLNGRNPLFVGLDATAITPHLYIGFQELGLPATPEEIHSYVEKFAPKYQKQDVGSKYIYGLILTSVALFVVYW